jgi:hypothetical protein
MVHPLARMDITGMHRMPARLTATMDLTGSLVACLSAPGRGSEGLAEVTGAEAASADAAVLVHADLKDAEADSLEEAGLPVARL